MTLIGSVALGPAKYDGVSVGGEEKVEKKEPSKKEKKEEVQKEPVESGKS